MGPAFFAIAERKQNLVPQRPSIGVLRKYSLVLLRSVTLVPEMLGRYGLGSFWASKVYLLTFFRPLMHLCTITHDHEDHGGEACVACAGNWVVHVSGHPVLHHSCADSCPQTDSSGSTVVPSVVPVFAISSTRLDNDELEAWLEKA